MGEYFRPKKKMGEYSKIITISFMLDQFKWN